MASFSIDDKVRLWDARTGEHVSNTLYLFSFGIYPQIEFHTGLGLIIVDGTAFEIFSAKRTKAMADDSSCSTSNLTINAAGD